MPVYSHSRLSSFENCPLQYKYRYIDKIEVERESIEAFMGSRVHDVLEKIYTDLKLQKRMSLKTALAYYDALWKRHWHKDIIIVKKDYSAEDYKKKGEVCIINYYNRFFPFDQDTTIDTEKRVLIDLDKDHKLQGYIDRLSFRDGAYEIHDYKTSALLPEQNKIDEDRQLALYSIAVKEGYKDAKKIRLIWHYLSFDKDLESSRTEDQLEELKKKTVELIKKIESAKEFNPVISKLCDYCDFREICPKWSHLAKLEDKDVKEFKEEEGVKLVDRFAELKQQETDIKNELEKIKKAIINYCRQFNITAVFGSDNKISWSETDSLKIPAKGSKEREELARALKELGKFSEVSDLDIHALKRAIENEKWDKDILDKIKKFVTKEKREILHLGKKNNN